MNVLVERDLENIFLESNKNAGEYNRVNDDYSRPNPWRQLPPYFGGGGSEKTRRSVVNGSVEEQWNDHCPHDHAPRAKGHEVDNAGIPEEAY